jgi:hypothetical protein
MFFFFRVLTPQELEIRIVLLAVMPAVQQSLPAVQQSLPGRDRLGATYVAEQC